MYRCTRLPSRFFSYFADVISTTHTQCFPVKYFTFQCLSRILSPCSFSNTPFLLLRISNISSRAPKKIRNILLLHSLKAAFFTVNRTHPSDYPVPLIVNTKNLFLPKSVKMLFGFIPHYLTVPYSEPI